MQDILCPTAANLPSCMYAVKFPLNNSSLRLPFSQLTIAGEDDGHILVHTHSFIEKKSYLLILDARDLS